MSTADSFHNLTGEQMAARSEAQRQSRKGNKARRVELAVIICDALLADQTPGTKIPDWALAHIAKAKTGRILSMVAAKCADCSGLEREEIKFCQVVSCPL
jgi:hypothetical protein